MKLPKPQRLEEPGKLSSIDNLISRARQKLSWRFSYGVSETIYLDNFTLLLPSSTRVPIDYAITVHVNNASHYPYTTSALAPWIIH